MVSMFGWVVLWARALNARVRQIGADIERRGDGTSGRVVDLGTTIGSLDERLSSTQQYVARRADAHDDKLVRLIRDLYGLRVLVQRTPSATAELDRVYRRLVHHDRPMPELGGWAMTSPTLVWAVDQISSGRVSTILECGSGSSTVWFALALEQRGGPGRIVSLESSPAYADEIRANLAELGLTHRAQVLTEVTGRSRASGSRSTTLVRPVSSDRRDHRGRPSLRRRTGRRYRAQARYPALPVLADRLTDDALVLLDDSNRGSEKQVLALWSAETHGGRRYKVIRELDRATVLCGDPVAGGVMHWADRSRGTPFSKDPSVVRFGDRYLMYVSVPPKRGDNRWGRPSQRARTCRPGKRSARLNRTARLEANGLCAGGAIVLGDRLHLFYQTYARGPDDAICHATSTDGVTFERSADNPIIRPTGDWTCGRAIDAEAHVIGDELLCYWATRDPELRVQMLGVHSATWRATSPRSLGGNDATRAS